MAETKKPFNEARRFLTTQFRLSHPNLFTPRSYKNADGPKYYDCEMLFDKETTDLTPFKKAIHFACIDRWGKDKTKWPKQAKPAIIDGDIPRKTKKGMKVSPEHKGMWVIKAKANSKRKLLVCDRNNDVIEVESDIYPGCICRAQIWASSYETELMAGVNFKLNAVQKIKDGKAIGGVSAEKVFGALAAEDDTEENFDSTEESFDNQDSEESFDAAY